MFLGTQRQFGVEVEFTRNGVVTSRIAQRITDLGVPCEVEGYNHITRSHWKIVSDASCGYEIVSPILRGEDGFRQLKIVLDTLTEMGVHVNRSTGVHVHLDANDLTALDVKNIVKRYSDNEAEIDQWFPSSRRGDNNTYCQSVARGVGEIGSNDFILDTQSAADAAGAVRTRFTKVNLASLTRYGTIEFRQHAGSTDYAKISNWILFLQHFVEQSRKVKTGAGPSSLVRRTKNRVYDEVRSQVEAAGGTMRHAGKQNWKVTGPNGQTHIYTIEQLDALYVDNPYRGRYRYLDQQAMTAFWNTVMGPADVVDSSLNSGVPTSVVEFFNQRREALAA